MREQWRPSNFSNISLPGPDLSTNALLWTVCPSTIRQAHSSGRTAVSWNHGIFPFMLSHEPVEWSKHRTSRLAASFIASYRFTLPPNLPLSKQAITPLWKREDRGDCFLGRSYDRRLPNTQSWAASPLPPSLPFTVVECCGLTPVAFLKSRWLPKEINNESRAFQRCRY